MRDFGAFVDLGGGVQGLLHVSEMGWSRVSDASQVVAPGEKITVKVLRVDDDTQKIALGLKQLTENPWSKVDATYEVGQVRTGRVTRVAEFGAFVELEPGVEGLAHASTFAPTGRREEWSRSVPVGMTGAFEILSIDPKQKRIGITLVVEGSAWASRTVPSESAIVRGAHLTGKVERHEKFGVFVFLAPGRTGLMPLSETGVTREADVVKVFPVGTTSRSSSSRWIRRAAAFVSAAKRSWMRKRPRNYVSTRNARMRRRWRDSDRSATNSAVYLGRGRSEDSDERSRSVRGTAAAGADELT